MQSREQKPKHIRLAQDEFALFVISLDVNLCQQARGREKMRSAQSVGQESATDYYGSISGMKQIGARVIRIFSTLHQLT
jgi:hypothetical protein